jgi:hypothetical protein
MSQHNGMAIGKFQRDCLTSEGWNQATGVDRTEERWKRGSPLP